jgi:hypothetical protein
MSSNNFNDFNDFMAKMFGDLNLPKNDAPHDCEEIKKLDKMLTDANIPHYFGPNFMGGYQVVYYGNNERPVSKPGCMSGPGVGAVCSAIETPISIGYSDDKIEISGLLTEEEASIKGVKGYLTAEDVLERILKHWQSIQ